MLVDLRRLERADLIILAAREIIQALSPNVSEAIPAILGARVNLARGWAPMTLASRPRPR